MTRSRCESPPGAPAASRSVTTEAPTPGRTQLSRCRAGVTNTRRFWVAAQCARASRVAGRHGDSWIHIHESLDYWKAGWEQVQAGADAAGRDPSAMERSLLIATLLIPTERDLLLACTRPTVQAFALAQRGSAWATAGAEHPFGRQFGGFSEINRGEITATMFAEAGAALTPEIYRRLMPCGRAGAYLRQFVEAGVPTSPYSTSPHVRCPALLPSRSWNNAG
jgi:alkanesulfonate monooxygenase SsuD/methylene tetrahydromethanopterin reductase-like flavin-dependent oxidoreductase (luciferase family)